MSNNRDKIKLWMSAKTRIFIAVTAVFIVLGIIIFGIVYDQRKKEEFFGASNVVGNPNIMSIPGSSDPSNQYINDQNLQNNIEAKKARNNAGSSVPTITRPNFLGNPSNFDVLSKNPSKLKSCSIKKISIMYSPNPQHCSILSLRKAREAGVTAEELICQSCPLTALKSAGYTSGQLRKVGFSATRLKEAGYSTKQLSEAGYSAKQLKMSGCSVSQLKKASFSAGQLAAAGYSVSKLAKGGFGPEFLLAAGLDNSNCNLERLNQERIAGVSAKKLKEKGCSPTRLKEAGFTTIELRKAGFNAKQLKHDGFNVEQLKEAGFSAAHLKNAGFSAAALKNAGYSIAALQSAGFSPRSIKKADLVSKSCSVSRLKKERDSDVSVTELRKRGCDLAALKEAGFTTSELKSAGFNAKKLKDSGFDLTELSEAGFSARSLKDILFTAAQLKASGYSLDELKNSGFTAIKLKKAGFSAKALKNSGFSLSQLRRAGYSSADLKNAGFNAKQLKKASFNVGQLAAAGFSPVQLKEAKFNAKQLRNAGFNATELKTAGFQPYQLSSAGYTKGDLLRAGFTLKQAGYNDDSAKKTQGIRNKFSEKSDPDFASKMNSVSIPSAESHESRLVEMVRDGQERFQEQQNEDTMQQLQGAMTIQAQNIVSEWSSDNKQIFNRANSLMSGTEAREIQTFSRPGNLSVTPQEESMKIIKAGTVMYAVLDTSVDTDYPSPVMATIVDGSLKGSKLLGQFTLMKKRVLLTFNFLNDPNYYKSIPLHAMAIDPNTARTVISGQVNNHYMLKYGMAFATSFLSGLSNAVLQSNSTPQCSLFGCVKTMSPLKTRQQLTVGLGTAGEQISNDFGNKYNSLSPTIKIRGGTGIGILFMSDLKISLAALTHKNYDGV